MTDNVPLINLPPLISLFGETSENFYQLGLKDRDNHLAIFEQSKLMVKSPWKPINKAFEGLAKIAIKQVFSHHPSYKEHISAYANGLNRAPDEVALAGVLPELVSFMDKWLPGIPHTLFGCSSYFTWDEKREAPIHGRVLDFPLVGSFDLYERCVLSQFDQGPKILSFGSAGFPFPSITAQTDNGISFALHQKFTDIFYPKGMPIFELILQMLQNCSNKKEVLQFLKSSRSLTCWAFYMGFPNGDVLAIDIAGEQLFYKEYKVEPGKVLYFCNHLEDPKWNQGDLLPYGFDQFNQMRSDIAKKKIQQNYLRKKSHNMEGLIKMMATMHDQSKVSSKDWKLDSLTPSSIQAITMCPTKEEAFLIPGPAPKHFQGNIASIEHSWGPIEIKSKRIRGKKAPVKIWKAQQALIATQIAFDNDQWQDVYHNIQKAILYNKGRPEEKISQFYFLVFQYIKEENKKSQIQLLGEFRELDNQLPSYFQDHCTLFIARLEKILRGESSVKKELIKNTKLQQVFELEMKLPSLLFHKSTATIMKPRVDILDIIYPHVRL